jgi:V8-like Glu-specific endopeptidase
MMGSGFFCKTNAFLSMITNNHILDEDKIKKGKKIMIEVNGSKKELKLDGKRKAYTNKSIDITVIEIKENEDDLHSFFEIDEDYEQKDLCDILILQFPEGKEASVSYGKIEKTNNLLMLYSASTLPGSSGGAILIGKIIKLLASIKVVLKI